MDAEEKTRRSLAIIEAARPSWLAEGTGLNSTAITRALRASGESIATREPLRNAMAALSRRISPAAAPSDFEQTDAVFLEAIVHTELRPAILLQDGKAVAWPNEWMHLQQHEAAINHVAARTGRVEIDGDPSLSWVGTGFVIAEGLVATNRHVVEEFAARDPRFGWRIRDSVSVRVDFAEEIGGGNPREVPVTGIWGVHDRFDIAILQMGQGCPTPLLFEPRAARVGDDVITIGYPAFDSRRNDAAVMHEIFRGIYNVKRLLPGRIMGPSASDWILRHDCSTLGGSSGSPLVNPARGQVVGIHFQGYYLRWNEAVNLTGVQRQ